MKILLALALAACGGPAPKPSAPRPPAAVSEADAQAAYEAKQWPRCGELYEAFGAQTTGPQQAGALYNGACCFALGGNPDRAFALLDRAVASGLQDVAHTTSDADLVSLHTDPRWTAALAKITANVKAFEATLGDPILRRELLAWMDEDQKVRMAIVKRSEMPTPETITELSAIDTKTTTYMKAVIAKHGWPGHKLVGRDGAHAAWLLVQHADLDPAFQKHCLELIEQAVAAKDASPVDYAYLYDRVAVAEKRPQRYGTQFIDGKPQPIEDEANVDARRKAIGLGTMEEYKQQMREMYGR